MTPRRDGASIASVRGEQLELEGIARAVKERAGLKEDDLVSSLTIARRVLGMPVHVLPSLPTQATITVVDGQYRILINKLEPEAHFAVAHELGHWALAELVGYEGPDEERFANRIAGALVAPRSVVTTVANQHRAWRAQLKPLARTTGVSVTAANLRLGEVLEDERAVLTGNRHNLMVRSDGGYDWDRGHVIRVVTGEARDPRLEAEPLKSGIDRGRYALKAR